MKRASFFHSNFPLGPKAINIGCVSLLLFRVITHMLMGIAVRVRLSLCSAFFWLCIWLSLRCPYMEVFAGHVGSGEALVLAGPAWSVAPKPYLALNASAGFEHHLGARHWERRVETSGSCLEKFAVMGWGRQACIANRTPCGEGWNKETKVKRAQRGRQLSVSWKTLGPLHREGKAWAVAWRWMRAEVLEASRLEKSLAPRSGE